jgi:hypothetical protein
MSCPTSCGDDSRAVWIRSALSLEVRIVRADNDPLMLSAPAAFMNGPDVVAHPAQGLHDRVREVLISEQTCHVSCFLVLEDQSLDLFPTCADVRPRVGEILSPEGGVAAEQVCFR